MLNNPTNELYELEPEISNSNVFVLQIFNLSKTMSNVNSVSNSAVINFIQNQDDANWFKNSNQDLQPCSNRNDQMSKSLKKIQLHVPKCINLEPKSTLRLNLKFTPCDLGQEDHHGCLIFYSKKVSIYRICFCFYFLS